MPDLKDDILLAVAVNRRGRFIRLDDDSKLPIVEMLDAAGNETDDPDQCVGAVFQLPSGRFSVVDLRLFAADQEETTQ